MTEPIQVARVGRAIDLARRSPQERITACWRHQARWLVGPRAAFPSGTPVRRGLGAAILCPFDGVRRRQALGQLPSVIVLEANVQPLLVGARRFPIGATGTGSVPSRRTARRRPGDSMFDCPPWPNFPARQRRLPSRRRRRSARRWTRGVRETRPLEDMFWGEDPASGSVPTVRAHLGPGDAPGRRSAAGDETAGEEFAKKLKGGRS